MVEDARLDAVDLAVRAAFAAVPGVVAAYVFGSGARGRMRPDSDLDVAVLFDEAAPRGAGRDRTLAEAAAAIGTVARRPVELIALNDAATVLRRQVIARGRRVLERDRRASRAFVARTLIEYWDLRPTFDLFDRALERRLEEAARHG